MFFKTTKLDLYDVSRPVLSPIVTWPTTKQSLSAEVAAAYMVPTHDVVELGFDKKSLQVATMFCLQRPWAEH